ERPLEDCEIARVEHLNASVMSAVKRGHGTRTVRLYGVGRRVEPDSEMVDLDWLCCRVRDCVVREHLWRRRDIRGNDKGFPAEPAEEIGDADAVGIGFDVPLVPGQADRLFRSLDHEDIEIRLRRKA